MITDSALRAQEERFAGAFGANDIARVRGLYHPEVVYLSPTVRLYDWPARIEGVDAALEFIQLTIRDSRDLVYEAVEWAITEAGDAAFVRIHYDFRIGNGPRLRSNYLSLYRYRDAKIAQQEIYYDPSGRLEVLEPDRQDRAD